MHKIWIRCVHNRFSQNGMCKIMWTIVRWCAHKSILKLCSTKNPCRTYLPSQRRSYQCKSSWLLFCTMKFRRPKRCSASVLFLALSLMLLLASELMMDAWLSHFVLRVRQDGQAWDSISCWDMNRISHQNLLPTEPASSVLQISSWWSCKYRQFVSCAWYTSALTFIEQLPNFSITKMSSCSC